MKEESCGAADCWGGSSADERSIWTGRDKFLLSIRALTPHEAGLHFNEGGVAVGCVGVGRRGGELRAFIHPLGHAQAWLTRHNLAGCASCRGASLRGRRDLGTGVSFATWHAVQARPNFPAQIIYPPSPALLFQISNPLSWSYGLFRNPSCKTF